MLYLQQELMFLDSCLGKIGVFCATKYQMDYKSLVTLSLDCLLSYYLAISHHVLKLQCFPLQYLHAIISEKVCLVLA